MNIILIGGPGSGRILASGFLASNNQSSGNRD